MAQNKSPRRYVFDLSRLEWILESSGSVRVIGDRVGGRKKGAGHYIIETKRKEDYAIDERMKWRKEPYKMKDYNCLSTTSIQRFPLSH